MRVKNFIEENFLIDDAVTGAFVPFRFNPVQEKYYKILVNEYGEELNFDGAREIILKARKEGFTSLILGIFAALDFLSKTACRSLEISYKDDATRQHFRRYKNFILSIFQPDPSKWDKVLESKLFKSQLEGSELVMAHNLASFYVGTASTRTGERGGTVMKILFSEEAHYQNTGVISASEIINGTSSMVSVGHGLIFRETTANGFNHFRRSWLMAKRGELNYRPRFFSYKEFYTENQFQEIKMGFSDKSLIPQEYPENETEAFLSSGRPHFNQRLLAMMLENVCRPFGTGYLRDDKHSIEFIRDEAGKLILFLPRRAHANYLIAADVAGGVPEGAEIVPEESNHRAWSVAAVFDRSSWEVVAQLRLRCDPGDFGRMLCVLGEYFNWAVLIPESNNHGAATIEAIKAENYPHLLYTRDLWPDEVQRPGFATTGKTKTYITTAVKNAIDQESYKENSPVAIEEMQAAVYADDGTMASEGGFLDCVITRGIGLYCLQFMTVDESYRESETVKAPLIVTSLVSKPRGSKGKSDYR